MPISSAQISGLIGGQQVMFSNQAAMAQQIGGVYGTGPMMPGASQNPYPSFGIPGYGAQGVNSPGGVGPLAVGTAGMALPGIAAGVSMAGGFAGGAAGYLDPFTGVASAAARGAGVGGQGFFGGLGALGNVFTSQGAMAGLSAVGRGMAFGAATALPYYAAGAAIDYVGGQIYQGAQNVSQVGEIMGRQGPFYGQSGFRPGGGMGRGQIRDIVQIMHDITGDADLNATMSQLTRLASRAQQGGMLTGVMNASDFKQKFTTIVNQVKEVAQIMGTSLDEAMPVLSQMRQMGMWRTSDVIGTAHALNQVGRSAAPQLLASMQSGAQMSWQQGGSLAAGASIGRNAFMQVQAATQAGVLPQEAIMELTGGVGGAQGQRMVAGMLGRGVSTFAQSAAGRVLMAGLGEMQDGSFTGNIDRDRLEQFMSGGLDIGQVMSQGRGRVRGRQAAVSFSVNQGKLGQSLMSEGGMGAVAGAVESIMDRAGYGGASDEVRNMFLQKLMGVGSREADMWRKMIDDLPQIQAQANRRARDAIDDQFRRLDERQNRSWQGFKESIGHAMDQAIGRPIQEFSANVATRLGQSFDSLTDTIYGKTRRFRVGAGEGRRMLMREGIEGLRRRGAGMDATMSVDMDTPLAEMIRTDPGGTLGRAAVGMMGPIGTAIAAFGMDSYTRSDFMSARGATTSSQMQQVAQRAALRAMSPSLQGLGLGSGNRKNVEKVKTRVRQMLVDPKISRRLREAKAAAGPNSATYMNSFLSILREDPDVAAALGGMDDEAQRDILAVAQAEGDFGGQLIAPFVEEARASKGGLRADPKALKEEIGKTIGDMAEQIRDVNTSTLSQFATGALGVGAAAMAMIPGIGTAMGVGLGAAAAALDIGSVPITDDEWQEAVQNEEWGGDMLKWMQGDRSKDNKFVQALSKGDDPMASKIGKLMEEVQAKSPGSLSKFVEKLQAGRAALVSAERIEEIKTAAGREMGKLNVLKSRGVSAEVASRYEELLKAYKTGDITSAGSMAQSLARDITRDQKALQALSGQGGVGRLVTGLARLEEFGQGTGTGRRQFERQFNRLGLGFSLEQLMSQTEFGDEISGMLADQSIDAGERRKIVDIARKVATERTGPQEGRSATAQQEKLYNMLTSYAQAHERFIWAVGANVTGMSSGESKVLMDKVNEMQKLGGRK